MEKRRLKDYCKFNLPINYSNKNLQGSFLPMEKIKNGFLLEHEVRKFSDMCKSYTYLENGFITRATVTPCFENGKGLLIDNLFNGFGFGSSELFTIKVKKGNPKFFYYITLSEDFIKTGTNSMKGVGGLKRVSMNSIKNHLISDFNLLHQTAIANYLDHHTSKIDGEVDYLEKKATLLEEFKQSLIFETVTKGLDKSVSMKDSGIEWLGKIPEHWEVKRVKKFISTLGKSKIASNEADDGVFDLYVSGKKIKKHSQANLKEFAILLPTGGKFMANLPKNIPCAYSTDVLALKTKKMQLSFLYYYLNCNVNYFDHLFFKGAGLKHLQRNLLLDYMIPTPNLSEQKQIADYLDKECGIIDKKVNNYRKKAKLLKEYKQSLIYEAVTGKIEIPKEFF